MVLAMTRPKAFVYAGARCHLSVLVATVMIRTLVRDRTRGAGFWFLMVSRSRSDGLSGFTGMFVRRRVRSEVQDGALAALRTTKERLER